MTAEFPSAEIFITMDGETLQKKKLLRDCKLFLSNLKYVQYLHKIQKNTHKTKNKHWRFTSGFQTPSFRKQPHP